MVKEEIVEGLKMAISKGEPLEKAMASFYNAGYKKEDIEEAAAATSQFSSPLQPQFQQPKFPMSPILQKPLIQNTPQIMQRVSSYDKTPKKSSSTITIILIILLVLLLGILFVVIIFKDQLTTLFNSIGLFWRALF